MTFLPTLLPPALLPPDELPPSLACCRLYRGQNSAELVDFSQPVLVVSDRTGQVEIVGLSHEPNRQYCYVVRRVSAAGVEEHNTFVGCVVTVDDGGNVLPPPLPVPGEVSVLLIQDRTARIAFTVRQEFDQDRPDAYEVLNVHGTGEMDLDEPLCRLVPSRLGQAQFVRDVVLSEVPCQLTVRGVLGDRCGAMSPIRSVRGFRSPAEPVVFPESC